MSKGHIPGSMDLLLDTMCNTFGSIVFIALSLTLAFFVTRAQSSPSEAIAKIKQELKEQQEEYLTLEAKRNSLTKKLNSVKEFSSQYSQTKTELPELVTRLEQDYKDLQREMDVQKMAQTDLDLKMKNLKMENKKIESEIREKSELVTKNSKTLHDEFKRISFIVDELNEQLQRTPEKKLYFAHNERTSRSPYVLLVKNNHLYRLGRNYFQSSREVSVTKSGNRLLLTGIDGSLLSSITSSDLQSLFRDFDKTSSFLWIMVHPDSFESFVGFRRLLRKATFPVYWYINTESILYLGNNTSYSASY